MRQIQVVKQFACARRFYKKFRRSNIWCSGVTNICLKGSGVSLIVSWQFLCIFEHFRSLHLQNVLDNNSRSLKRRLKIFHFFLAKNGFKKNGRYKCSGVTNICLKGSGVSLIVSWQFLCIFEHFRSLHVQNVLDNNSRSLKRRLQIFHFF